LSGRVRRRTRDGARVARDSRGLGSAPRAALLAGAIALLAGTFAGTLPAQRLPFTHFSADDGLAATQVWHVTQDRRGLLWIATTWGINRFDGVSFTTFSIAEGLPSANTRITLEDREGNLWFGTNAGLAKYDGVAIESFVDRGGALSATVWSAGMDRHGALWFGTDRGLISVVGDEMRTFTRAEGLADDYAYGLLLSSDGGVWVGSRGHGVSRCSLERAGTLGHCRVFTSRDGLGDDSVHAFAEDPSGAIFVATRGGGISRFDGDRFSNLTTREGLPSDDVYALAIRRGELYVGTDDGLAICALPAGTPCRILREANGLPDDGVRFFFEDREGALWIGAEGGLARLAREDVLSYGEAEGLPDGHVYALASDGAGGVWVGTFGGLAHLTTGGAGEPTIEALTAEDGLPADWVWSVLRDRQGAIWVGGEAGIARYRLGRGFERWTTADGLAGNYIVGLLEDRGGAIWAAGIEGLSRLDFPTSGAAPRVSAFRVEDGLAAPRAYAVAEDGRGRVWVAHGEGLSYFDGGKFHVVGAEAGIDPRSTRSFGTDREGALWVGGQGQLARLLPDEEGGEPRFLRVGAGEMLAGYLILSIVENDAGQIVLGTNHGVLTLAVDGEKAEIVGRFDRGSGAPASELSHSSAFTRDAAGRLWFGFKGGATVFRLRAGPVDAPPPPELVFESLATNAGRELKAPFTGVEERPGSSPAALIEGGLVELPRGERSLRVRARALALAAQSELRYQFRLEGLEADWSEVRPDPIREYVGLRPGSYRLAARARFGDGAWGAPAYLELDLLPAWYETGWLKLLAALLGVAALVAAVQLRTRGIAARNRALAGEVAARTDDLARYARALEEHVHALDRANERIRRADRHRGEFLAKMSHELRTPLTSVLGFTALLKDGLEEIVEARFLRYLQNIRESGNHLLRLINNLLDQAKIEAGKMDVHLERASIDAVVDSALAMVEGLASTRSVTLAARREGELPLVTVDVAKLRQIVINLLSNAIKFAPSGSEVEVVSRTIDAAGSSLGVPSYEIVVADRGPGIPLEDRERIFEPFRQLSARGETLPGTGLGLPIVRQFAHLLGGVVRVGDREGGGALLALLLPIEGVDRTAGSPRREAQTGTGEMIGDRPRVLVVEPDRGRFTALATHLDRRGLLAVRAPDAEEGVRMLRELRPAVLAVDLDPARVESWTTLAAMDRERTRGAFPWVLFAFASGTERGIAVGFHRFFAGSASAPEILHAVSHFRRNGRDRQEPAEVWIAAGERAVPPGIEPALDAAGFRVLHQPPRSRVLAGAATFGFSAAVVDLGDGDAGGLELVLSAQASSRHPIVWIGLAPEALPSGERRRLLELAEDAGQSAGEAIASAVETVLRR
jgi:signal transduction histidine kinase/ligand-binding sensor domain-containing protein/ActR/RegA family two-component response regulator